MRAFVFPGQGSQKRGMGQELFDKVQEFKVAESQIDAILGCSVRRLCLEDKDDRLRQTQYTQPCLYIANALHYYQALTEGKRPEFTAGHSVGEYSALLAAGAFDLITGLRLVQKRGELMSRAKNGGMAAVVGLDLQRIQAVLRDNSFDLLDIANQNAEEQTVISGPVPEIERAKPVFERAGASTYMTLQVSAAFHSRYMESAEDEFADFLGGFSFNPLKVPVISNVTGRPYPTGDPTVCIRYLLTRQITQPVLWLDCVRCLLQAGVTEFDELGPGIVLTNLIHQIRNPRAH